jgi:hypothetical protein
VLCSSYWYIFCVIFICMETNFEQKKRGYYTGSIRGNRFCVTPLKAVTLLRYAAVFFLILAFEITKMSSQSKFYPHSRSFFVWLRSRSSLGLDTQGALAKWMKIVLLPLNCKIWVFRIVKLAALASHSQWRVLGVFALSVCTCIYMYGGARARFSSFWSIAWQTLPETLSRAGLTANLLARALYLSLHIRPVKRQVSLWYMVKF